MDSPDSTNDDCDEDKLTSHSEDHELSNMAENEDSPNENRKFLV